MTKKIIKGSRVLVCAERMNLYRAWRGTPTSAKGAMGTVVAEAERGLGFLVKLDEPMETGTTGIPGAPGPANVARQSVTAHRTHLKLAG
jgi:hypothetical protein